jgi:hypothetical protein
MRSPIATSGGSAPPSVAPRAPRRWTLALTVAFGVLLASAGPSAQERPRFDVLFIQPSLDAGFATPARRQADLDRAVSVGARAVVVQYLGYADWSLLEPWPGGADPIGELLDEARVRGLKVWLGTWEDPRIWRSRRPSAWLWRSVARRGVEVARIAAERYGDHPALAGWYFTPEAVWWSPPGSLRLERFSAITWQAVRDLESLTGHPVAIVLGPSGRGEANLLGISWCRYIEAVDPDVVVAMDSVGSGALDVEAAGALYGLLHPCAQRTGAQLWSDVELFGPDGMDPTLERLWRQYRAARAGTPVVAAFDLPTHMAPGTAGARFADGARPPDRPIEPAGVALYPDRDWGARPFVKEGSVTVELPAGAEVARVEFHTRQHHPRSVTLSLTTEGGAEVQVGSMEARHGPGRDEWTWIWEPPTPRRTRRLKLYARGGRWGIRPDGVRVFAP